MITKFKDVATFVAGQSPESKYYSNNSDDGLPFLQGNRTFGMFYPTFDTYTLKITKVANEGDILMSVRAPVGDLNFAPCKLCIGRGLSAINAKDGDNKFLFYALKYNVENLLNKSTGSTFDSVSKDIINDMDMILPDDKSSYPKISKLLSTIDSKIENNNKINSTLESIAKTLYDYYFLQFDFPGKNGKPYKSSGGKMVYNDILKKEIPEGWEVKKLKELVNITTGKEDANFSNLNGKFPFFTCSKDNLKCDIPAFDSNAILISGNGDFNVKYYCGKFNAYQRTYVIIPKNKKYDGLIYQCCKNAIDILKNNSVGSIIKYITLKDIENINILYCNNDSYIEKFNNLVIYSLKINEENEKLSNLRDFLLPLLMNGQAKIL